MQTAKHWSLAAQWPPSPCYRGTHARVAVSRPLIAPQLRTGSSRHGGMGDFVHAAVTCYILINSPAGKKYKSNHVCNNFSFFIHRETPNFVPIDVKQVRLHGRGGQEGRSWSSTLYLVLPSLVDCAGRHVSRVTCLIVTPHPCQPPVSLLHTSEAGQLCYFPT